MERYRDMQLFAALAGQPSLTSAARDAQVSGPTLVRAIARLEARLRISLLQRSTRGVSLTDAGSAYLTDCMRLLAEHLALSVLGIDTEVFDFGIQRFLEVPRFDRVGQFGRLGVFSLRALEAEFVGDASATWPSLVSRLVADGHVHADAIAGSPLLW